MKNLFFNRIFRKLTPDTARIKRLRAMNSIRKVIIMADLSCNDDASRLKSRLEKEGKKVCLFLLPDTKERSMGLVTGSILTLPSLLSIHKDVSHNIEMIKNKPADALFDLSLSHPNLSRILVSMADASLKVAISKPGNDFVDVGIVCNPDSTLEERFKLMAHYLDLLCPPQPEKIIEEAIVQKEEKAKEEVKVKAKTKAKVKDEIKEEVKEEAQEVKVKEVKEEAKKIIKEEEEAKEEIKEEVQEVKVPEVKEVTEEAKEEEQEVKVPEEEEVKEETKENKPQEPYQYTLEFPL